MKLLSFIKKSLIFKNIFCFGNEKHYISMKPLIETLDIKSINNTLTILKGDSLPIYKEKEVKLLSIYYLFTPTKV